MTPDIIQWIIGQGSIAGFAIWMLVLANKSKEDLLVANKAETERYARINREDKILLLAALDKSSEKFATLTAKIDGFSNTLDSSTQRMEARRNERATNDAAIAASQ